VGEWTVAQQPPIGVAKWVVFIGKKMRDDKHIDELRSTLYPSIFRLMDKCKLQWNLAVNGLRVLATMVPSYTRSSRTVPWVQVA
jgi:hypothetical protein